MKAPIFSLDDRRVIRAGTISGDAMIFRLRVLIFGRNVTKALRLDRVVSKMGHLLNK